MWLMTSPSKNVKTFYTIKFVRKKDKSTSEIVEKLGTETFIKETYGVDDAEAWVRSHVNELNAAEKAAKDVEHFVRFPTNELIPAGKQLSFNTGYLFLQKIYYQLGLPSICKKIKKDNAFTYDLNAILSRLVCGRIIFLFYRAMNSQKNFWNSPSLTCTTFIVLFLFLLTIQTLYRLNFTSVQKSLLNAILVFYFMTARITFLSLNMKMD